MKTQVFLAINSLCCTKPQRVFGKLKSASGRKPFEFIGTRPFLFLFGAGFHLVRISGG